MGETIANRIAEQMTDDGEINAISGLEFGSWYLWSKPGSSR